MLKKFLLIAALLLSPALTLILPGSVANAEADSVQWVRVTSPDVYLLATDGGERRFAPERSYYLELLGETENMYLVAVMQNEKDFPRITGYVYKSQVSPCSTPLPPYYPTVKLTVTAGAAPLRLTPNAEASAALTATNLQQLSYYGTLVNGGKWYYVYYAGCFGYVQAELVSAPAVPLHPTPLPSATVSKPNTGSESEPEPEPETGATTPTSEILLIVFVVLLAVGLTLALFLPGNLKKSVFDKDI